MTENEALKTLEDLQRLLTNYRHISKELTEANGIAIQALEEIQQYRAIGTVDECAEMQVQYNYLSTKIKKYESIGTVEDFKALKEKNTPKELAEHNFQDEVHHYLCPSCRSIVSCTQNYCEECGQALET